MRNIISFLLVTILSLIILSGCSTPTATMSSSKYTISGVSPALGDVPEVSFELAISLQDFPDKLPVYKMIKPNITEEYVKNLGAKFGLTGEISEGTENFLMSDNTTRTYLEVYKATGTFRYYLPSKEYPEKTSTLPSDAEALKIATDFLVDRDLLPKGDVAYKVQVGGTSLGVPAHLLVSFKHAVQIIGPGARHGVRIGDGGEVVEVFFNPTNPLVLPTLEIVGAKPIQQAYEEMKNNKNFSASRDSRKIKIDDITIAYWIEAINKGQDYVAPTYFFKGQCLDKDGKLLDTPFGNVIEALQ
jgi:hypothetical protein